MSFALALNGRVVEVTLDGQLVADDVAELKQAIREALGRDARHFRIVFAPTINLDRASLAVLVSLWRCIRDTDGDLRMAHLADDLQKLFLLTKLDTWFPFDDDGTAGRPVALEPKPPAPRQGREQAEPPPPEDRL
jgi:anti-anti-sigma factor